MKGRGSTPRDPNIHNQNPGVEPRGTKDLAEKALRDQRQRKLEKAVKYTGKLLGEKVVIPEIGSILPLKAKKVPGKISYTISRPDGTTRDGTFLTVGKRGSGRCVNGGKRKTRRRKTRRRR